ncbi:MAG: short-chain dehydrogenase [Alphaproteobacteria bacterium]|nr:MAG: short-chain dehydrogenase [Alphaproteobacteria bacterium]
MPKRKPQGGIPRGIDRDGPAILSYGFRPFFLAAGCYGVVAMAGWVAALTLGLEPGGRIYGAVFWHGHEMLFGYAAAALAGFLLTAVPNWTGRLPVSGYPLLGLLVVWTAGRIAMLTPESFGLWFAALLDMAFLPLLAAIIAREVLAGRNWKNLKVLAGVSVLALSNGYAHFALLSGSDPQVPLRLAVASYVALVALVGGRIIPSFTRNWLARKGATRLPASFDKLDMAAVAVLLPALLAWAIFPDQPIIAIPVMIAALLNAYRLWRWRGAGTIAEPLVAVLHAGYSFLPLGLLAIAASALGWASQASSMHVLTVGVIGVMTLAVMTRASLGHTGRSLVATRSTSLSYLLVLGAAATRPFAEALPDHFNTLLAIAGAAWIAAFGIFILEYGPILLAKKHRQ